MHNIKLRAHLYSIQKGKPTQVFVPTRCLFPARQIGPWYPFTDSVLDTPQLQPYVHDCCVRIHEGNQTHQLRVFFKRHRRLQYNNSLPFMRRRIVAQGDFVVMRVGVYPSSVVNMRGHDPQISDWVIGRYVLQEQTFQLLIIYLQVGSKDTLSQVQENTHTIQFHEICFIIVMEVGIAVRLYNL